MSSLLATNRFRLYRDKFLDTNYTHMLTTNDLTLETEKLIPSLVRDRFQKFVFEAFGITNSAATNLVPSLILSLKCVETGFSLLEAKISPSLFEFFSFSDNGIKMNIVRACCLSAIVIFVPCVKVFGKAY